MRNRGTQVKKGRPGPGSPLVGLLVGLVRRNRILRREVSRVILDSTSLWASLDCFKGVAEDAYFWLAVRHVLYLRCVDLCNHSVLSGRIS